MVDQSARVRHSDRFEPRLLCRRGDRPCRCTPRGRPSSDTASRAEPAGLRSSLAAPHSDDPENVTQDGLLFRSTVARCEHPGAGVHVSRASTTGAAPGTLIVESTGAGSQVQWLGGAAAGDAKPMYVGHRATVEYLRARQAQAVSSAAVAPGAPLIVPVAPSAVSAANPAAPADGSAGRPLVQAIYDLRVLSGDPVRLSIVAVRAGTDPLVAAAQPLPSDGYQPAGRVQPGQGSAGAAALDGRRPVDADLPARRSAPGWRDRRAAGGRPLGGDMAGWALAPCRIGRAIPIAVLDRCLAWPLSCYRSADGGRTVTTSAPSTETTLRYRYLDS